MYFDYELQSILQHKTEWKKIKESVEKVLSYEADAKTGSTVFWNVFK